MKFLRFKNDYDFLFTEDDIIISKDNYLKIGIDIWNKNPNAGCFLHSTTKVRKWRKELGLNKNLAFSCHGATGLSSSKILNKVVEIWFLTFLQGSDR